MSHLMLADLFPLFGILDAWQVIALLVVIGLLIGYFVWKKKQG